MIEEKNNIFLASGDALVYLAGPMQKNIPQYLFGAIHLTRTYLLPIFQPLLPLVSICTYLE